MAGKLYEEGIIGWYSKGERKYVEVVERWEVD